jgi:uncharacterized protein YgbK (DUF1537 family)
LPPGPIVAFYGDDFTGSTAVLEVLTFAGLPSVLFLDVPTPEQRARFAGYRGVGIAGVARSKSPAWMERHLPPVFDFLATVGAPIAHYKICSTMDSAPRVGSIGKAADLAIPVLGGAWHPFVVAAPAINRWQAFGNLFAAVDGTAYRLDRHPTMSRHPVTPMHEADVRRHLGEQTRRAIELVDLTALQAGHGEARIALADGAIVALDVVDDATLAETGRLVWEHRGERLFAVGSQGLEYALVAHWREAGLLDAALDQAPAGAADRIAVVAGSCSPVTAAQIAHAEARGFAAIKLDAPRAVDEAAWSAEVARGAAAALGALGEGRDPIVYTASGLDDPAVAALSAAVEASGADPETIHARIGAGLGHVLAAVLERGGLHRAIVAGGDSSGHAGMALGIDALTALAPIAPGAPLCRAHRSGDVLELALKGGQMGTPDYFSAVKRGRAAA